MLDFFRPLGRDIVHQALVTFACEYAAEKGRQWAMGRDNCSKDDAPTPASETHTSDMEQLISSIEKTDEQPDSLSEICARQDRIIDGTTKTLNDHLNQPGSMFYLSSDHPLSALDDHFKRFKNPDDIDKFIRGEERVEVLEMAELYKVLLAN